MKEFELIRSVFAPLAQAPGALGLTDDGALVDVPLGKQLVLTKDLMISGVHFRSDDPPADIAAKLLRVNLSDLAAMGAHPIGYLLGLALPASLYEDWVMAFACGLTADQKKFGISLFGGDVTAGSTEAVLSLTAFGLADHGATLRRSTASAGDLVFVTGTVGDAALGLAALTGEIPPDDDLIARYRRPEPPVALGARLAGHASACIDISDGLLADLGHICTESGVGAQLERARIPLSAAAESVLQVEADRYETILAGGDDYQLLFTAPPSRENRIKRIGDELGIQITCIGVVNKSEGVTVLDEAGQPISVTKAGYDHFER